MSQQVKPRVILLTGAASGIGWALAQALSKTQHKLIITARKQSLTKIWEAGFKDSDRLLVRPLDVTSDVERRVLFAEVTNIFGGVDVLINNAGISYRSVIEHMTEAEEIEQLQTNFLGPVALIREVLPHMRAERFGRIINVSSVGGMMAMPTMGSYSASKFALEGAAEALWYEVKPWNVHVTLVQPGFINSNSFRQVRWSKAAVEAVAKNADYAPYYRNMSGFVERLMGSAFATPESIARKIVNCIDSDSPPLRLPVTIDAHVFSLIRRFLPRRFYHWLLYRNLPGVKNWVNISAHK